MAGDIGRVDWNDYRVFTVVARAGSFRAASKSLGTSPQGIAHRIGSLENKLGVRLFNRVPHGVELTPEGHRVFSFASAAEAALVRAASTRNEATEAIGGECRIAMGDGMATYWLPRFFTAFGKVHPDITLYTHSLTERTTAKAPRYDIQIQYADTPDETLVAQRIATLHFMLFASKEYLAEHEVPNSIEDLAQHRLVDFTLADSDKGTFALWRGLSDRARVIANAVGTQCETIRWGGGVGLLTSYAGLVYPNLVPLLPSVCFPTAVYVCFEREAAKRPAVRATLDFIKDAVYDHRRMPWFADEFIPPEPDWPSILRQCMDG